MTSVPGRGSEIGSSTNQQLEFLFTAKPTEEHDGAFGLGDEAKHVLDPAV